MWPTIGLIAVGMVSGGLVSAALWSWMHRRAIWRVKVAERRARTAERLADLGAMTGGLAHEIKNPLSTIGLNAQLLAEAINELEIDSEAKGRLTRRIGSLTREAERLKGILADFLEFAGVLRLDRRRVDINQVLAEMIDFFMPQAQQQGVRLRADLSPGPLWASVDAAAIKQSVLNLMLNAVQAMASGTQAGTMKELIVKTAAGRDQDKGAAIIHVMDTGPGIPADRLAKVFEPYFTTKPGGTGLGLPTTKRMIEAHGGRLDVITTQGTGTDFVITLPVDPEIEATTSAPKV